MIFISAEMRQSVVFFAALEASTTRLEIS